MTVLLRAVLVGVTIPLIAGALTPLHAYGSLPEAGVPSGSAVLRQAATAMERSLHAVHTEGQVHFRLSHQVAQSRVSGDCVMTARSQADQFQSRGTTFVNGQLQVINVQYISVQGRTWRRSGSGAWQRADADQGALMSLNLCPTFFLLQPGIASLVPRATNRGAAAVGGRKASHITLHGTFLVMDVDVDQQTHYWLRIVSDVPGPPRQHATFDYSAFNHPVSITPPKLHTISATRPVR
jgi:hypothetical protein